MRILIIVLILMISLPCYAARICLEKSTGKLIEYQSKDGSLKTLRDNATRQGYKLSEIEVKNVSNKEWEQIKYDQIIKPAEDKNKIKKQKVKNLKNKLKQSLSLSKEEIDLLLND